MSDPKAHAILTDPKFRAIVRKRLAVSFFMAVVMAGTYFTYICFLALKKDVFATVVGRLPIGLYFGVGLIVLAWVMTGIYVFWANTKYDPEIRRLRDIFEKRS